MAAEDVKQPEQPRTLFRGRPYTKVIPFAKTFAAGSRLVEIWKPVGAQFELALIVIKGTVAAEYAVCDSKAENIIGYVQVDGVNFSRLDLGMAAIRSNPIANAVLMLNDAAAAGGTVHGTVYGWEVTPDGNYR